MLFTGNALHDASIVLCIIIIIVLLLLGLHCVGTQCWMCLLYVFMSGQRPPEVDEDTVYRPREDPSMAETSMATRSQLGEAELPLPVPDEVMNVSVEAVFEEADVPPFPKGEVVLEMETRQSRPANPMDGIKVTYSKEEYL